MNETSKKILWFEGAGCVPRGDVENCRIRTAFRNDKGEGIYLELSGMEVTKNSADFLKQYTNAGHVDHCFYIVKHKKEDMEYFARFTHEIERKKHFEYRKQSILNLVNETFGCSFDEVRIADNFYGYFVHGGKGSYIFMDDHVFDDAHADAARTAFNELDMMIRRQLGERYSQISLMSVNEDTITVRCYASKEKMTAHGMNPNQREITVSIWA